ncbi:MAG: hypothetical protein ACJA0X_002273 [Cyclobacteriaceae bacterium]|jgi:hypothetical protein
MRPENISNARPKEEIVKIGLNLSPTRRPVAPNICNIIVARPSFSNPNRLNSLFIFGEMK